MSTITHDKAAFKRMWMDTPIAPPQDSADRRALKPGTCVQTRDHTLLGRVHTNDEYKECIVIGHGWNMGADSEVFVWRGTKAEFDSTWTID